jgi:hypothetical protein
LAADVRLSGVRGLLAFLALTGCSTHVQAPEQAAAPVETPQLTVAHVPVAAPEPPKAVASPRRSSGLVFDTGDPDDPFGSVGAVPPGSPASPDDEARRRARDERVMARVRAGIRRCFNRAISDNPSFQGRVTMTVHLEDGRPKRVVTETTADLGGIGDCLSAVVMGSGLVIANKGAVTLRLPLQR